MNPDFWHRRWARGQTGFHQTAGHPMLAEHWPGLGIADRASVLVPLCGKSPDMAWLAQHGCAVTGVELSAVAAADYFTEQRLDAQISALDDFQRHAADGVEILVGDMFAYPRDTIAGFAAFYDRAALIALPEPMRARYVDHVYAGLRAGAVGLLITFDYPPADMDGPPFAVTDADVRALAEPYGRLELLAESDTLRDSDHLRARGLTHAVERAYRFTRG